SYAVLAPVAQSLGYELKGYLGGGAFGEVWRATSSTGFDIALQFIRLSTSSGSVASAAGVEWKALLSVKNLPHPFLLTVSATWRRDEYLIIAMERADDTLYDRLHTGGTSGIPRDELLRYLRDAAEALDFLATPRIEEGQEKFLQHRDIKPQNLMRIGGRVKVADFGLATVLDKSVREASARYTPSYAAPEVLNRQVSRWTDQYALACSYCVLRGGRLPFEG